MPRRLPVHPARLLAIGALALATIAATGAVIAPASRQAPSSQASVTIAASHVVATVSPRYVSFAVDLDQVVGGYFWSQAPGSAARTRVTPYDFKRLRLLTLTRALSPAYLRISGTAANETYYDLSGMQAPVSRPGYSRVLTRSQWDAVNHFAGRLGLKILFGINAGPGPRDASGAWAPENARELLQYTAAHGYPLGALEFGNEPNLFSSISGLPESYSAANYAHDLQGLKALRDSLVPGALLVGPGSFTENAGRENFGRPFGPLASQIVPLAGSSYDALTWHSYAARSTRCPVGSGAPVPSDPLAPSFLDGILKSYYGLSALGRTYAPGRQLWLGEAGTAYCGGQPGYSDRWEATFWYLNALGQLAKRGVQVFVRQTLSGSDYGLIDEATLAPNPDYWAALLWHRLMGTHVLRARTAGLPARLRVFAACAPHGGGATLAVLNLDVRHPHRLRLDYSRHYPGELYIATSPQMLGKSVELNGRGLTLTTRGELPALRPKAMSSPWLLLPPASYAFVAYHRGAVTACLVR